MPKAKKPTPRELYWAKKRREEQEQETLLPPGLVNHGNTCFMNSVLQGLIATDLLESLVRFNIPYDSFIHPLAYNRSPLLLNGRGPEHSQKEWVKGMPLGDIFIDTLERAWQMREAKDRSSMSPRELLGRLGQKYDQYLDFRQQDAHEFFLHLLDGMRMEEFDIIKVRQPRPIPKNSKGRSKDVAGSPGHSQIDAISEEERLVSFVNLLWGGKFTSVLVCATCKHVSHTYEDFDDLSLSINHDESKERKRDRLRAFASKFISQSNRSRDQGPSAPRPQSASQPPSPAFANSALEPMDDMDEPPRRRSFEDSISRESTIEPEAEKRKVELLAGIRNVITENGSGITSPDPSDSRPRRSNEVNLGKLGRRISISMSLGVRKEKKPKKLSSAEGSIVEGESDGEGGRATPSSSNSKPVSRSHSPNFFKKSNGPIKLPSPPEHVKQKAAYLRRLLEDTAPSMPNALALLRMANPNGTPSIPTWTKVGSSQSVEDCLKVFTAVEALDGDNMFGCRNCWKIANGQAPGSTIPPSDDDSDSSDSREHLEGEPSKSEGNDRIRPVTVRTWSAPLLPSVMENRSAASLPSPTATSPASLPFNSPLSEGTAPSASPSELNVKESASMSTTSVLVQRHTDGFVKRAKPIDLVVPATKYIDEATGPREVPIPTIATISPSPDTAFPSSSLQQPFRNLNGIAMPPKDSLGLSPARAIKHLDVLRDGGESSLSSEESERDDTSGISDADTSPVPIPQVLEMRRSRRSSVPRAKQVIYRRALKRYLIAKPPPILVIHLKRFQQVSKSSITLFGNLKKLDDFISFPEYLDIRPFLAPKKEDYGLGKGELKGKVTEKGMREEDLPCTYRLYAIVVHIGNMLGGHYIAYTALPSSRAAPASAAIQANQSLASEKQHTSEPPAKQQRQWCYISDTAVRLATLEEVLKAKAYLCMYERVR